ncbi:hypothetical protein TgHK011_001080 [Trichoderma gracile]|nr:hypothetical protein TgHK011_001080 [Trichoderma gracile]
MWLIRADHEKSELHGSRALDTKCFRRYSSSSPANVKTTQPVARGDLGRRSPQVPAKALLVPYPLPPPRPCWMPYDMPWGPQLSPRPRTFRVSARLLIGWSPRAGGPWSCCHLNSVGAGV